MKKKIGIIGFGNMGRAIYYGASNANVIDVETTLIYDINYKTLEVQYEATFVDSIESIFLLCDIVIVAVKPDQFETILANMNIPKDTILVSIAAGITTAKLCSLAKIEANQVVRVMPNTPVLVNCGASAICRNERVDVQTYESIRNLFSSIGLVVEVEESQMDAIIAVSGSSPAYVFLFLNAMIQTATELGLSYDIAKLLAVQAVHGAAKMVETQSDSAYTLMEKVCSPNGTTIEAVHALEENNFEEIIRIAMLRCAEKSRKMSE